MQYNNPVDPKVVSKNATSDGSTSQTTATASNTTDTSGGKTQVASGVESLSFTHTKLSGVGYIVSAAYQDGNVYFLFSAGSQTGPFFVGVLDPTGAITSKAVADITPLPGTNALQNWITYHVAESGQANKVYLSGKLLNTKSWAIGVSREGHVILTGESPVVAKRFKAT